MIDMTLEGGVELEKKMKQLEVKVARKVSKDAVRASAKTVLAPAKENAKGMVGGQMGNTISRALQLRVGKNRGRYRRGQFFMRVQHNPKYNDVLVSYARGSKSNLQTRKTTGARHYIPAAIEYGHAFPGQAGGTKQVAAIPYLRSAFDVHVGRAQTVMRRELFSGIERVWRVG
jgi:hypothetical protein